MRSKFFAPAALVCLSLLALSQTAAVGGVVPIGTATVSFSYPTADGLQTFTDVRDFSGTVPTDATIFGDAPNIKEFNSLNSFGWRMMVPGARYPGESVITQSFFKINNGQDYFPGILEDADLTITVSGMHFGEPVSIDESTFMVHTLWDADQVDQIEHPYIHVHNFHTATNPFRDFDLFVNAGVFTNFPHQGYALDDFDPVITGNGTDTLGYSLTIPYHLLRHLDEEHNHEGNDVPPGLPAPHGFLEPFHLHIEYAVVPEPATLLMLVTGAGVALTARRRRGA